MSRPTILLTGATGLLGRYILLRLMEAGLEVVNVVRAGGLSQATSSTPTAEGYSKSTDIARRRIEQVLQPFEEFRLLPRPRAIAWDFAATDPTQPSVAGLNGKTLARTDFDWLSRRNLTVIHCAASIRFQSDPNSDEPYRTNVRGTQNLINLCQQLRIESFHHVSTAYVGEHRSGNPVYERPVDQFSDGGNDYERSKIRAEQLICAQLANIPVLIHRPSIVVGDSKTCFSSTFHGFYAPLQIGWQYAKMFGFSEQAGQWFRQQLGLKPDDSKNLVTVDWVAEGIVRAVLRCLNSNQLVQAGKPLVLHWTNPKPVACNQMQAAIVDSIERSTPRSNAAIVPSAATPATTQPPSPEQFRDQMQVYESYFQSDPTFDNSNAAALVPDLVCPSVDYDLLAKLSDWAIAANFGWPKPILPELENRSIVDTFQFFNWLEDPTGYTIVRVQLLGPGSPDSVCFGFDSESCFRVADNTPAKQCWRLTLQSLKNCITGTTPLSELISQGYWLFEGKTDQKALDCAKNWINHIRTFLQQYPR